MSEVKLNIGAGDVEIEGFTPVDRRHGSEAYPLAYEDNSVDEIRASHILEHFGHREAPAVLCDWVRTLKPGGTIRIAVPDFPKIVSDFQQDPRLEGYLFGGQTDENDYHKSLWNRDKLAAVMADAGLTDIEPWVSQNTDCASLPVSLNLQGRKSEISHTEVKVVAMMTHPRYGPNSARNLIERAFHTHGIPVEMSGGVYYGQCMQRMMEAALEDGVDVIVTVDSDTCPTAGMVAALLQNLVCDDSMDALAALEPRRNNERPLMTAGGETSVQTNGRTPILATTAHFGLTALRTSVLAQVPKPWFFGQPDENGEWGDGRMDPDIWFWHQWREAGFNLYVDPTVRIGHLEEVVAFYDEQLKYRVVPVPSWREKFLGASG